MITSTKKTRIKVAKKVNVVLCCISLAPSYCRLKAIFAEFCLVSHLSSNTLVRKCSRCRVWLRLECGRGGNTHSRIWSWRTCNQVQPVDMLSILYAFAHAKNPWNNLAAALALLSTGESLSTILCICSIVDTVRPKAISFYLLGKSIIGLNKKMAL